MFTTIPIGKIDQLIDSGSDIVIIDLRSSDSYARAHIQGAINIPYYELETRYMEFDRSKVLVFYCARGGQSLMACRFLEGKGYRVIGAASGFDYYRGRYLVRG